MIKHLAWLAVAAWSVSVHADWLTLTGTPGRPESDSVQVDPRAVDAVGDERTLHVRVNRSRVVADSDGLRYRSMEAEASVDCGKRTARYVRKTYYAQPNFLGAPVHQRFFGTQNAPALQFDGISETYPMRLIKAACKLQPS